MVEPQILSSCFEEQKNLFPLLGIKSRFLGRPLYSPITILTELSKLLLKQVLFFVIKFGTYVRDYAIAGLINFIRFLYIFRDGRGNRLYCVRRDLILTRYKWQRRNGE
jgi:hypothetical protein